jgi:putative ABC transport system permease protein
MPRATCRPLGAIVYPSPEVSIMPTFRRPLLQWTEDLYRDIVYGIRTLARTRGFTAVAMTTLALGISAVTVIYSVVRNVVFDPFPYTRSERMVNVVLKDASNRIVRGPYFPASEYLDYQEQTTAFEDVVATSRDSMFWAGDAGTERLDVAWMTGNGFDFLGVPPLIGRTFDATDTAPGAPRVAVMSHRAWNRLFAADQGVLGRTMVLNGEPWTVVGVMPPRFEWNIADLWLPAALERSTDPRTARGFRAFQAHLRPGVTAKEAEAQLNVVAARRAAEHPNDYPPNYRFEVIKVIDWVVRDFRGVLYTLFGAVSLLLIIACCNVANMLLARATVREREFGIRVAIGASRARIVRQLLVESALLACGGLAGGCLLAYAGISALAGYMPRQGVPWETQIRLDQPVLMFAAFAAVLATVGFGVFPALQSARRDVLAGTSIGGRTTAGRRQTRMRGGLVVAQVALSMILLLGAGLLMRTFVNLIGADLGIDQRNVLVAGVGFPPRPNAPPESQRVFYRELIDRLGSMPGVRAAAISNGPAPFAGTTSAFRIPGIVVPEQASVLVVVNSEGLFPTAGIPLIRGRAFSALDVDRLNRVAVVNETLARKYFGAEDPLGRSIFLTRLTTLPVPVADPTFEIIGVVRDMANQGPRELPMPQVFIPYPFRGPAALTLTVRTAGEPMALVNAIRHELLSVDPEVALIEPTPLDEMIQRNVFARPRFSVLVLGIFAATGVLLVALGVYGVLAYTVSQQRREIAIRMALGGQRGDVIQMVLRLGLQLVGAGLLIGAAASLATNRLLVTQLWNISPHDPLTFGAAMLLVLAIGAAACWVPARRAVRVEPMAALRQD